LIPLSRLRAGQSGRVGQVRGKLDVVHRLQEMGLFDGAAVEMVRPGSPCIIKLHGQRLGFRMDDLAHVMIHLGSAAS
jgi:ferrous iron transport protein A